MAKKIEDILQAQLGALMFQNAVLMTQVEALTEENQKLKKEMPAKESA
jgi:hypothetical protein